MAATAPSAAEPVPARGRRILLSYATAGLSKGVAAAVQLLALPVVALALGAERFGALLVLGGAGAICCVPARAIVAAASIGVARARGLGNDAQAGAELWSAALLSTALGFAAAAIVGVAALLLDPAMLFGAGVAGIAGEARAGLAALVLLIFATYFLAWVEGVRTGYEENHFNNLFALVGSAAALAGIAAAWAWAPTIPAFFVAIYVLYPLLQGLNLALLPRARWSRAGGRKPSLDVIRGTARRALGWSVAQAGIVLHLQGSIYLAAQAYGLAAGALVGGMVRLFQIFHNLMLALLNPVLPTLSHAAAAGDRRWIAGTGRHAAIGILVGLTVPSGVIALFGDRVVATWLGLDVPPDAGLFAALGVMALLHMAAQLYYLMLLALGDGRRASLDLLRAGLLGIAAGVVAIRVTGLAGLIWAQAIMMLLVGFAPIALRLRRRLGAAGAAPASRSDAEAVAVAIED
jgi:O-antigen/teichoic acid export membrane protein